MYLHSFRAAITQWRASEDAFPCDLLTCPYMSVWVCASIVWVIVQHLMCLMQQLSWAMHATELKCTWLAHPGGFSLSGDPKDYCKQCFTSPRSQEHHTEDGSSISHSSSFTILLIRACQVQFQMICVVSGMLPILKAPFFLSVESWNLWFCII